MAVPGGGSSPRARRLAGVLAVVVAAAAVLPAAAGFPPAAAAGFPPAGDQARGASRCPEPVAVGAPGSPVAWRAPPELERVARALAENRKLLAPLPGIGEPGAVLEGRPTVWVVEDLGCLEAYGLGGVRPDWVAGVASSSGGFIALRASRERGDLSALPAVFRHELAHLALAAAAGGRAPRWLQEGYAQYAAGSWDWREAWRLRFALLLRGGDILEGLSLGFPRDAEGARLAYLLSYTAVHELVSMAGSDGLAAFFGALRQGDGVDGALRRVYGLTLDQFEERWRGRVETRYGWLYVVSRASVFWLAVTLLLLWMGWRRRRRDRRRMEALREAERREAERGEEPRPWEEAGWTPGRPPGGPP